jgi:uncharacterized protein involved in response to NO
MSLVAGDVERAPTPAFLTVGFRPFFIAAAIWSVTAMALWIVMLTTGIELPSRFDPLAWHIHEMLFGFVMATIAGFLLTAIPTWTRRVPVSGLPLAALAGLWLLGRIACLVSALVPPALVIAADLAFPLLLVAVAAREIIAGRNWRNLPMIAPVIVLGLAAVIALISVVAGRIVPSFTRNWLATRRDIDLPAGHGWIDRAALGALHAGLFSWAVSPAFRAGGALLLLGAGLNLWRLLRWRGGATVAEPLLLILHIGYAWLVLGAALLGLSVLDSNVPQSAAIHALTAGAIGTMILAVMTRVTRGHSGRALSADRGTVAIYLLVNIAAITRVVAAVGDAWATPLLIASAILWIGAFVLFITLYGPLLLPERAHRLR